MAGLGGLCWVGFGAVLALACGRTANSEHHDTSNGSAGTGNGANTGGSGPTSTAGTTGQAGELGAAGAPAECPATPIAGRWVARGPDPYGIDLKNDGTQIIGQGCLGGFAALDEPPLFGCDPLSVLADTGRSFDFVWDAGPSIGLAYSMKMQLTLSPERDAMAGKLWSNYVGFDGEGVDIVFVPYPGEPTLPATTCSGGEPSGACFLAPLRSDHIAEPHIVEVANGDLLMLWLNQRGYGKRVAGARFDAASGAWQPAEFLDEGTGSIESLLLSTSPDGWAMVAYTQGEALVTHAYSPKTKAWSKPQLVVRAELPNVLRPSGLSVYEGGDAFLVASTQYIDSVGSISAYEYSKNAWTSPHVLEATAENAFQWASGSDAARHQLAVWVRGGRVDKPHELWFSSRDDVGAWSNPAQFYSSEKQILRPALAIGEDGNAIVTWQEFTLGINSNSYSFEKKAWGEPTMVTTRTQSDNRALRFDETGAAVAYFHDYDAFSGGGELKSVLTDGVWGAAQACTEMEMNGETYTLIAGMGDLTVAQVVPGEITRAISSLERPRCEGY